MGSVTKDVTSSSVRNVRNVAKSPPGTVLLLKSTCDIAGSTAG